MRRPWPAVASVAALLATGSHLRADEDILAEFSLDEKAQIVSLSSVPKRVVDPTNIVGNSMPAITLGRALFFDPRLSGNGQISCASCHDPKMSWTDGASIARGATIGRRNTPSLWNVALNRWFSWDGKAGTLWAQVLLPIESPAEMGGTRSQATSLVAADKILSELYRNTFNAPISAAGDHNVAFSNLGKALASYVTTFRSSESRFDAFAAGVQAGDRLKLSSLSVEERRGLKLFLTKAQCINCHHGPSFSDGEFHNLMLPDPGRRFSSDSGRYGAIETLIGSEFNAAGPYSDNRFASAAQLLSMLERRPEQWGSFKTPSLRNVARTAPYMHAGQFTTLFDVVSYYSTFAGAVKADHHQEQSLQPLLLSDDEINALVAFLGALTDESQLQGLATTVNPGQR